uniref:Ovule protein n=1 Tax=Heterorhabditis bacteriophora TaxID=37862 RepID=A0A1I7X0Z1_HETBA
MSSIEGGVVKKRICLMKYCVVYVFKSAKDECEMELTEKLSWPKLFEPTKPQRSVCYTCGCVID